MWECLNATWNALPERQRYARWVGPHAFFCYVEERAAMLAGLADSTMSRDDGWRFFLLGRSVERVDMIVRLLLSRVADRMASPGWLTVLRCARRARHLPAHLPRRAGRGAGRAVPAPGPAVPALGVPRAAAGRAVPRASWTPADRAVGAKAEALRLLGRARTELEFLRARRAARRPARASSLGARRRLSATSARPCRAQYFHASARGWPGPHGGSGSSWATATGWSGSSMSWRIRVVHTTGYSYDDAGARSPTTRRGSPRAATPGRT